jgi:hypothetical protein
MHVMATIGTGMCNFGKKVRHTLGTGTHTMIHTHTHTNMVPTHINEPLCTPKMPPVMVKILNTSNLYDYTFLHSM